MAINPTTTRTIISTGDGNFIHPIIHQMSQKINVITTRDTSKLISPAGVPTKTQYRIHEINDTTKYQD